MFAISLLLIFLLNSREPLASLLSLISCLSAKVANFDVAKSSVEYSENFGHSRESGITQYEGIAVGEGVTWQRRRTCTILFVNLETAHKPGTPQEGAAGGHNSSQSKALQGRTVPRQHGPNTDDADAIRWPESGTVHGL